VSGADLHDAVAAYRCVDDFFGAPSVDVDETRAEPVPHRYVHGGFDGTATRFSYCFPERYERRFFHYLQGGFGGSEHVATGGMTEFAGVAYAASRGGFLVESNQGHAGAETCPKGGDDATVYAYRASAEAARFARHLAAAIYGEPPEHGYVFGGSGGGYRTIVCMERTEDRVWDAGVASVVGSENTLHKYAAMNNARRLLGTRFDAVVDAVEPGGSGDPFGGLTTAQREALADLYACGFPRGAERSVAEGFNAGVFLWTWQAEILLERQAEYFDAFWSQVGHAGADGALDDAVIDVKTTVARTVTPDEAAEYPISGFGRMLLTAPPDKRVGIILSGEPLDGVDGARITITSGAAAGRRLYCVTSADGLLVGSSMGEAQTQLFDGVEPGDEVHLDNRDFLAYCSSYRHHPGTAAEVARLRVDGRPIHPQHEWLDMASTSSAVFGGLETTGALRRPLFLVQHTHDSSGWPSGGTGYADDVLAAGDPPIVEQFRFWWLEHAEHVPAGSIPARARPVPTTRLIDFGGAHEAALDAMVAWIERGVRPPPSTIAGVEELDQRLVLPDTAAERLGLQPVAIATADGAARADVRVGDAVAFVVDAAAPPDAGAIVEIAWDFDGRGTWPVVHRPRPATSVRHEVTQMFDEPGTYFPVARVVSHLAGDGDDPFARVTNLGRCRVVVR
jgi:hypothetical protein